ncbi:MAG: 1-acyl-sn-glycerol-3-phosphate acyltransferase [Desulfonauticus sp.]|jgi:1-acyl-sn-glycerol-3-phosphate acyltransferase|nr:MAG: Phospholipid/glycerol acyltransferase [Desulfonauticus sp. 38_4375]MDK2921505.1 1-acyl-sn-glycerol-3-phosphate acyltransferase [Desulfonauticus sp.]
MWFKEKVDSYQSPEKKISWIARHFPGLCFYHNLVHKVVFPAAKKSKQGVYTDEEWVNSSYQTLDYLEQVGVKFFIEGRKNFYSFEGPCVFVANHMSTLETFVLPCIIHPLKPITFIIKQSLLEYPVFKHVMRTRDPIAVSRTNPREDFKVVMTQGVEKIKKGLSIVVFPQTTRTSYFSEKQFNSIGVKLAKKANVPVVPIALKTDAWGTGRLIKDMGKIDPQKKVLFSFAKPLSSKMVQEDPKEAQAQVVNFIKAKLQKWGAINE